MNGPWQYRYVESSAVFRCRACGAEVSFPIRQRSVGTMRMPHEERCSWIAALEHGSPVPPISVEIIERLVP